MRIIKNPFFSLKIFCMLFVCVACSRSYAGVYENVAPAIVNVQALHLVKKRDFFDFFFPMDDFLSQKPRTEGLVISVSGTCLDETGLVVTNRWAVADAQKIACFTHDGKEIEAHVVYQHENGLALLKLVLPEGVKMPTVKIGEHDVGHTQTVAIGFSKKMGTLVQESAILKTEMESMPHLLTLSKPVYGEYSGGPLVQNGKIVGLLDAMLVKKRTHGSKALAFAISAPAIQTLMKDYAAVKDIPLVFKEDKMDIKATLLGGSHILSGYSVADMSADLAKKFKLDEKTKGVVITHVPDKALSMGFMSDFFTRPIGNKGDIIRAINDSKIETVEQLVQLLKPADQTIFKIELEGRGGRSVVEMHVGSHKKHKQEKGDLTGTI
jgi:S1-C subfamily serine protease